MMQVITIFMAFLFCISFQGWAQGITARIAMPDTTVKQGTILHYPVYLSLEGNKQLLPCTLRVEIPRNRFILKGIETVPGTLFSCKKPNASLISPADSSQLIYDISCDNPLEDTNGIAFNVLLEVLAGDEKTTMMGSSLCTINNTPIIPSFTGGLISFADPAIAPAGEEGIEINNPNPFVYTTSFPYYIARDGEVAFSLFSISGKLIKEYPALQQKSGRHIFTILVDNPMDFSSGIYIVRMKTGQGTYHMSIVHEK